MKRSGPPQRRKPLKGRKPTLRGPCGRCKGTGWWVRKDGCEVSCPECPTGAALSRRLQGSPLPRRYGDRFPELRDDAYRAWIRQHPCLLLSHGGCSGDVVAAHVHTKGSGGADHGNLVPLCHYHHGEQHAHGIVTFQTTHFLDLVAHAVRLYEAYLTTQQPGPLPF